MKHNGKTSFRQAIAVIHRAIDLGVTFFDTAEIYDNNEILVGEALATVQLSEQEVTALNKAFDKIEISGDRYPAGSDAAKRVGK